MSPRPALDPVGVVRKHIRAHGWATAWEKAVIRKRFVSLYDALFSLCLSSAVSDIIIHGHFKGGYLHYSGNWGFWMAGRVLKDFLGSQRNPTDFAIINSTQNTQTSYKNCM